ncbi:MAG: metallophosphoesterase [Chlamydiia bacterium]|nr:metallophosphoesterase [Chlamydiia bacterium]
MRIAHLSDLHYIHLTWNPLRLLSKRILGNMNWFFTRQASFHYPQLDLLPQLFQELGVDLILFAGDLTTTALKEEYQKARKLIQQFPCKWIAVPGNHDHYTYTSFRKRHFYQFFSNAPGTPPFRLKQEGIELHKIAPNWWLIALDTTRATHLYSSQGFFTEEQETRFKKLLQQIPSTDSVICLNHYPFFPQPKVRHNLVRKEALQTVLEKNPQIRLYLQGHTHRHIIADLQPSNLPILLDSGSCVQKSKGTWNLIDLMPDHCAVTAYQCRDHSWTPFRREVIPWKR